MKKILRDYFSLNKSYYLQYWFILVFALLGLEVSALLRLPITKHVVFPLYVDLLLAGILVLLSVVIVIVFGLADALVRGRRLAREAGMRVDQYVVSEKYRLEGREKLKWEDKGPKWW